MGLSLLNVVSRANFRMCRAKLLSNFVGRHGELRCTRPMSNCLQKTPTHTTKNVSSFIFLFSITFFFDNTFILNALSVLIF